MLVAQGDLSAALAAYQASRAIRERLATADPGNAGWQRDLSVSHNKIGNVLVARIGLVFARQGERQLALGAFGKGREIIAQLQSRSPDNAVLPNDLAWFDGQIALA